ncbi:hypothetical protein CW357_18015 [Rummeliibacillus sp. TYF005]|uniref:TetR-like C-terminal domain-containing protein n=1 Tax=Rummeliibacillus sp. TYF005 TaxID=2058214 RepID=UPI000F537A31|nr:TetR-like C-terminal domain-containing protein [Rummeliibacillus sp. TYF005]RPJ93945.1 hypothetical protein CW357_18015 [Rummeliibacillus sp. TYF005]
MPVTKTIHFLKQDIDFYRLGINTQRAPSFIFKLKEIVIEKILSDSKIPKESQKSKMYVYRVHYLIGGLTSMYQDWLEGKFDGTLEELTEAFCQITIKDFS